MMKSAFQSKYRFVIGILIILNTTVMYLAQPFPVPLFTTISAEMGIDLGSAGIISTVLTLAMAVMMVLGGSFVIEKFGAKYSIAAALLLSIAGNCMTAFLGNYALILVGRALVGIGIGLNSVACISFITMWFPPKERTLIFSLITICCTGAFFIAYSIAIPLMQAMGTWQRPFLLLAALSLVFLVLWLIFGKTNPNYVSENVSEQKTKNSLLVAIKRKDVLLITAYSSLIIFAQSVLLNYLPAYLETVHGYSAQQASTYSGFLSVAQMIGGLVVGVITGAWGKRKPALLMSNLFAFAFLMLLYHISGTVGIVSAIIGYGLFAGMYSPVVQTMSTEIKDVTPELASAAYSLSMGVGNLLTFFTPMILSLLMNYMDLSSALYVFAAVMVIGIVIGFFVKETGTNLKKGR